MNIPNKIQIAGKTIDIVMEDMKDIDYCWGKTYFGTGKIGIAKNMSDEQKQITFIHELVHMIFETMGESELRDNEKIVHGLAELLYQVVKQI